MDYIKQEIEQRPTDQKKILKVSKACDNCRKYHRKCDGGMINLLSYIIKTLHVHLAEKEARYLPAYTA